MSTGILTADGSTEWVLVRGGNTQVSINDTFGGGTVAVEKLVNGSALPVYDGTTAITATAPEDMELALGNSLKLRLTLSGATAPSITWAINPIL